MADEDYCVFPILVKLNTTYLFSRKSYSTEALTLQCLIDGVPNSRRQPRKYNKRVVQISKGGGKLRNPLLKMKYIFVLFIPNTYRLINCFSTRIYLFHTEISSNTFNDLNI